MRSGMRFEACLRAHYKALSSLVEEKPATIRLTMLLSILPITLFLFIQTPVQQPKTVPATVAVTTQPDQAAVLMSRADAEALYAKLKQDGSDPALFRALTVELGKLPDPVEEALKYCERKRRSTP